jgi:NAD(P)H-nitrite reductase large subunit
LTTGLAIVSIGARLDTTMAKTAGLAVARGVRVDEYLRTSDTIVFACGDIAELEQPAACSARRATNQGRIAGSNAKAASGPPWLSFREKPVPLDLKCGDFELHVAGVVQPQEPATEETSTAGDCQEVVLEESSDVRYRSRIVRHGVTIGIQMVGTGKDIARYANEIGAA